jgi:hypothetical protein
MFDTGPGMDAPFGPPLPGAGVLFLVAVDRSDSTGAAVGASGRWGAARDNSRHAAIALIKQADIRMNLFMPDRLPEDRGG